jgi:hypothetical protein
MALTFPTFLYHKDHAPLGRIFHTAAAVPTEPGWVETPAKFDPTYVAPPETPEADGSLPADAPAGYVPQPYPTHVYHRGTQESRLVADRAAHAALEAADPGVWINTPDVAAYDARQAASGDVAATTGADPALPTAGDLTADQAAAFAKSTVGQIVDQLQSVTNAGLLAQLETVEGTRAAGPRTTVLKALKARALELTTAA